MDLITFEKTINEKITYTVSFTDLLPDSNTTILSANVSAETKIGSPVLDANSAAILIGEPQIQGNNVLQQIEGGLVGCTYIVRFIATLSSDEVLEDDIGIKITNYVT